MSDIPTTIPPASERTLVEDGVPVIPTAEPATARAATYHDGPRLENPLADLKPETPRTHPIAYAALALAALAFLLSIVAMTRDNDNGFRQVKVGNGDCVIGPGEGGDVLYCRAAGAPAS